MRQALTESLFRLDLQASFNAPLFEEKFQIGEAASDMVIVSQRIPVGNQPEQPPVAAQAEELARRYLSRIIGIRLSVCWRL
ncbi:hypothetical protein BH20VER3_BH20VER3_08300 [soil metagenome]